jgi:FkbM family methyltransferase
MRLVYDVGMFNGDDTDYYLKKGFRVVGIEANPHLIPQLTERFSADIEQKCLVIENVAVAESSKPSRIVLSDHSSRVFVFASARELRAEVVNPHCAKWAQTASQEKLADSERQSLPPNTIASGNASKH